MVEIISIDSGEHNMYFGKLYFNSNCEYIYLCKQTMILVFHAVFCISVL